jgi:hypothetical protein
MSAGIKYTVLCAFLCSAMTTAVAQTWSLNGQASGWLTSNPDRSPISQTGARYIPDLTIEEKSIGGMDAYVELSVNAFAAATYARHQVTQYDWNARPYRAWFRLASNTFEARVGLQKLSFGSATFFRPLMWFDSMDPRDPLQLTSGVYGLLVRYYFPNNTNIWLWGLYGNNATKGWEIAPTRRNRAEYGGRVQTPLGNGEVGLTYHHRQADLTGLAASIAGRAVNGSFAPEDRLGLDGKWDLGPGVWFEAVLYRRQTDLPGVKYQRQWTLGSDYTFDVGEGLTATGEFFRSENPDDPLAPANGLGFSALSLSYPLGIIDRLAAIVYRDWTNRQWYRLMTWQRTYDNWSFYLLGFWNPESIRLYQSQAGSNPFAGTGVQLMAVFNH